VPCPAIWYKLKNSSGDASVNSKRGVFCIDDPTQGAALYRLDSGAHVRTYPVPVQKGMQPRQVSFAEDCSAIVSGSDHGVVYIFDRRKGDVVDELRIESDDWVQTVLVSRQNQCPCAADYG
jgi:hypothetical protein